MAKLKNGLSFSGLKRFFMDTPHGAELVTIISPDAVHILHTINALSISAPAHTSSTTAIKNQNPGQQIHGMTRSTQIKRGR